jgi:hypothetical protein
MRKNYIGRKHGMLTVISQRINEFKVTVLLIECDCGIKKEMEPGNWSRSNSCGCGKANAIRNSKSTIVEAGEQYGLLTIVKEVENIDRRRRFLCICDCGKESIVRLSDLKSGNTKSCKCILNEKQRSKHRLYNTWNAMMQRCGNKNNPNYKNYGKRGIKVCDEWKVAENFYNDMDESYCEELTIDRIDVNGNYCKENCRWATVKEQQNNKRTNRIIKHNGKLLTISQLSDKLNLSYSCIRYRVNNCKSNEEMLVDSYRRKK